MGGYKAVFSTGNGIERTIIANSYNGVNYVFAGNSQGIDVFTSGISFAAGTGPYTADLSATAFTPDSRTLWQFDFIYSPQGDTIKLLAHPGLNLNNIDNGVKTQVMVGDILPGSGNVWTFTPLSDTAGQHPTGQAVSVDGGVCCLYPFIFVYGSNGYIANNNVDNTLQIQTLNDWNGPLANQVNMSSSKIVKGMPTRGGTYSPSGLFWATDSLIRVSFTAQAPTYWRYDIISSQISIMSSSSVVEMDGIFYWMGVDRFYQYTGSVQALYNDKNVNWLFDNLNYTQRQKVWATKVPRYNEIWFFYPRGTNTECTDAIIYNVKDQIWYDAGQAVGAHRAAGYTTELFPYPLWSDWSNNPAYGIAKTVVAPPSGMPQPSSSTIYFAGDQTPLFSPGDSITTSTNGNSNVYTVVNSAFTFNSATQSTGGITLITIDGTFDPIPEIGSVIYLVNGGYNIWQHEYGQNMNNGREEAIYSSFTTCDISFVGGNPSQRSLLGTNRRTHLRRIEPDFVQTGEMKLNIIGNRFAQGIGPDSNNVEIDGPFPFTQDIEKIDLRKEHREIRLQFSSNVINGNYEMGRILVTAELGDQRP
jgi:hypothetical protein